MCVGVTFDVCGDDVDKMHRALLNVRGFGEFTTLICEYRALLIEGRAVLREYMALLIE